MQLWPGKIAAIGTLWLKTGLTIFCPHVAVGKAKAIDDARACAGFSKRICQSSLSAGKSAQK